MAPPLLMTVTSSSTAEAVGVGVVLESAATISRNLPEGVTIRPNASAEFLMIPAWGSPIPNEIHIVSAGFEDAPQIVPVPLH